MSWLLLAAAMAAEPMVAAQIVIIRMYVPPAMTQQFAAETQAVATTVLLRNGISPVWVVCPQADPSDHRCDLPIDPAEVVVRTLSDRAKYGPDRCGEAYLRRAGGGQMITLFLDCSETVGRYAHVSPALVHGHMLVHEMGHLLLGPDHAETGIMQCPLELRDWRIAAFGWLNFTREELPGLQTGAVERWYVDNDHQGGTR
jgi:hypothetical protein